MFRGITSINIDAKGRIAIPTRYRDYIHQDRAYHLIVTIDPKSPCLLLYPFQEWEVIEAKLQGLSSFQDATRRIQRLILGHATELEMDPNGRVLLPQLLRDYAKLEKRAMLVGQGKKFELWDEDSWQAARSQWLVDEQESQAQLPDSLLHLAL
jgi:MraZ protein